MPCSSDTIRMTPVVSQCQRVPAKDMANLGELCPTCHAAIGKHLTNGEDTEWHHLVDYIKLFMLLGSDDKIQRSIGRFGNAIAQDKDDRGLSFHLKRYETICWFPDVEVIPTGVLSPDEFYDMIARGVLWKDIGATLNHGLYAHRLQWHAVLSSITDDFTIARGAGWNHTGYELFVHLGSGFSRRHNLWGKIFDASGFNCFRSPEHVEPSLKNVAKVNQLIETKYAKHQKVFKAIPAHAQEEGGRTFREKRAEGVGPKAALALANKRTFDLTDALWGSYYFGRRGILDAVPQDDRQFQKWRRSQPKDIRHEAKQRDDRSKRFAPGKAVLEHNGKILRLNSQIMPSADEVRARQYASRERLNTAA